MLPVELIEGLLAVVIIALVIGLGLAIMYYLNLQNMLKEIHPSNRTIEPTNVWLMFIPLFNIVYGFIMYSKITESIKNEYEARGYNDGGNYLKGLGMAIPILAIVGIIPTFGSVASLAGLVVWIIYWVKSAEIKKRLMSSPNEGGNGGMSSNPDILD